MRILLDECVPARLGEDLLGHEVRTVPEMGWASQENGALLALAESRFDVFVTTDQRITYQQAVSKFTIALVVLVGDRKHAARPRFIGPWQSMIGNLQSILNRLSRLSAAVLSAFPYHAWLCTGSVDATHLR